MRKYLNLFRILYLILLLFVFANFLLLTSFWTSMVMPLRRSSGIPGCI